MRLLKLPTRTPCERCGLVTEHPHPTVRECMRAIDGEMRRLIWRSQVLTRRRGVLLAEWLEASRRGLHPALGDARQDDELVKTAQ